MESTEERVKKIVAEYFGVESVKNSDSFVDNFGADSLDYTELVMSIEEEFGVEIPDEDLPQLTTVQQVIDYLASHGI